MESVVACLLDIRRRMWVCLDLGDALTISSALMLIPIRQKHRPMFGPEPALQNCLSRL